jgi:CBS-domain-containing membrane protein
MRVQDFMTHGVCTVRATDGLDHAAQLMWDRDCGALPVVDDQEKVVGMITDRDICMASHLAGKPLFALPVSQAMSKRIFVCHPEDSVATAEAVMRENQVRRLPVVDARGRLVGILSINDIAIEAAAEAAQKQREVTTEEVGVTLAAICRHRDSIQSPVLA